MAKLGDPITKKLSTGRLYLRRKGENNYADFGNVTEHKPDPQIGRAEHMKSDGGFKTVDFSNVKSINPKYIYSLDEHTPELLKLMVLGTQGADIVQAGGAVVAEALTGGANSKQGRTYFALAQGLTLVTVKVGGVAKVLDVDYQLDPGIGAVTIIPGGGIVDNSAVTIDYTAPALTRLLFNAFTELRVEGDIKYVEKDQNSTVPRQVTDFYGQIHVANWGENSTEDYNKIGVECIPLNKPTITVRKD